MSVSPKKLRTIGDGVFSMEIPTEFRSASSDAKNGRQKKTREQASSNSSINGSNSSFGNPGLNPMHEKNKKRMAGEIDVTKNATRTLYGSLTSAEQDVAEQDGEEVIINNKSTPRKENTIRVEEASSKRRRPGNEDDNNSRFKCTTWIIVMIILLIIAVVVLVPIVLIYTECIPLPQSSRDVTSSQRQSSTTSTSSSRDVTTSDHADHHAEQQSSTSSDDAEKQSAVLAKRKTISIDDVKSAESQESKNHMEKSNGFLQTDLIFQKTRMVETDSTDSTKA